MIGIKCRIPSGDLALNLRKNNLLVGQSGSNMIRLLPPLNVEQTHLEKAVHILEKTLAEMNA